MADDSLEALMLFRPRIAGRRSEADAHPGPRFATSILRLQSARMGAGKGRTNSRAKGSTDVRPPGRLARRCVIKARFVPVAGKGQQAARLHLSYLERDGVERDGSPGTLYGRDDSFEPASMREPLGTESRQFQFIVSPEDAGEIDEQMLLLLRLETLSRLGLAGRLARGAWLLHDGWEDVFKGFGERGDIIERIHQLASGDVARYRIPEPGQPLDPIDGVVRGKGLHHELTGDIFAVIETQSGETQYVRLDQWTAESLRVWQIVRVATIAEPWVKQTDHMLARPASLNSGIYDPARHLQPLTATASANPLVSPSDLVAGKVRRLERLERYHLATRLGEGRWRIPLQLAEEEDNGAIAATMALLMGMRASEIVERTVRNLDDGGRLLWITNAKTQAGIRRLEVPPQLRGHLQRIARGKGQGDRLFGRAEPVNENETALGRV